MAAYMVAQVQVTDPTGLAQYQQAVTPLIARYGGQFRAAAPPEVQEGEFQPHLAVIVEFPTLEQARAWYNAPEYQAVKAIRQRSASGNLVFVDGLA
jgi:uncharacterized protein (DUF1330 family)